MKAAYDTSTTTTRPQLVSVNEARRQLGGISRSTIYLLMEQEELKSVHIRTRGLLRGRRMILQESLEDYVKRLSQNVA